MGFNSRCNRIRSGSRWGNSTLAVASLTCSLLLCVSPKPATAAVQESAKHVSLPLYSIEVPYDDSDVEVALRRFHDGRRVKVSMGDAPANDQITAKQGAQRPQEFLGYGTHFVKLYIGNPAQKRTLAVMSGSDFTAFPCDDCTDCGPEITNLYQRSKSASFAKVQCGHCISSLNNPDPEEPDVCHPSTNDCFATATYVDHSSWTGYEARDYVYIGGAAGAGAGLEGTDVARKHGFEMVFACQTRTRGWFSTQVKDGVLGFSTAPSSFVNQMHSSGKLGKPRFSLCFSRKHHKMDARKDGAGSGVVTLGGYDPTFLDTPMVYAQTATSDADGKSLFKVYITAIYLREGGGQSVVPDNEDQGVHSVPFDAKALNSPPSVENEGGHGGTAVDSGTPFTLLDHRLEAPFREAWKKITGRDFTYGKQWLTEKEVLAMPTVIIQLKAYGDVDRSIDPKTVVNMASQLDPSSPYDAIIAVPATNYMERNPNTGSYRARLQLDSKTGSVLGANMMQGHTILYDFGNNRIGFAEAMMCEPKVSYQDDDDLFTTVLDVPDSEDGMSAEDGDGTDYGTLVPDDDLFVAEEPSSEESKDEIDEDVKSYKKKDDPIPDDLEDEFSALDDMGGCHSVVCRSFVGVGYVAIGVALGVVYRLARPPERPLPQSFMNYDLDDEDYEFEARQQEAQPFDPADPEDNMIQ